MAYKVVITDNSMRQFDRYLGYVVHTLQNKQAARNIMQDFRQTVKELAVVAGSMKLLDDLELAERGYRKLNFQKHNYLMVYRIEDNTTIVDAIFHTLQDYENALR